MFDFIPHVAIPGWLLWITGGASVVTLIALAIFAPPIFNLVCTVASGVLKPVGEAVGYGLGLLFRAEVDGGAHVLSKGKAILFCATLMLASYFVAQHYVWKEVHADYRLTHKVRPR